MPKIKNEPLIFQVTDWDTYHEEDEIDDKVVLKYVIQMFGTTIDKKKIYVKLEDFTPFFYVRIPSTWKRSQKAAFMESLTKKVYYEMRDELKGYETVKKCDLYGFTNYKKFTFLRLIFHSYEGFKAYRNALYKPLKNVRLGRKAVTYKMYEPNIEPFLRCIHISDIKACGWVKLDKYTVFADNPSTCEIGVFTKWTNIKPYDYNGNAEIIVASYDIECTSTDGGFPQAERDGDQVIQIGTTFNRQGEQECFYKHIITLDTCDPIEGADVESYKTEKEVLLAWTKLIQRMNPDVMTGYNIFGFDYKYLQARAAKLGIHNKFSKLGRMEGKTCEFTEKHLKSSALGDNYLYYYNTPGRIQVDLFKVVQREYNLGSYKLDNVASHFIRGNIKDIIVDEDEEQTTLKTPDFYGLDTDRYVKLYYHDGLTDNAYADAKKFKILELNHGEEDELDEIVIKGIIDVNELPVGKFDVYWTQAKDDVKPQDIFAFQKQTSAKRAIVARYCLQDCILVNRLLEKLVVLTNNIGMANVCHVPLQFIFMRGQGIKGLSLVAKKCREKNHLIPLLDRMNDDQRAMITGYEGATVLKPEKGIHYSPTVVKDYASLYPRCIYHRNISHETTVEKDGPYDNLPGYYYYDVKSFNKNLENELDGTTTTTRFAKKMDGSPGIIPEICMELLEARSATKKKMKAEKDPFLKSIWNGLQLAQKVTANSMYGLTGGKTSALYYKCLAASTTATGREMLQIARLFSEYIFPKIVEPVKAGDKEEFNRRMDLLFTKRIDELLGEETVNLLKNQQYKDNDDPKDNSHLFRDNDHYYLRIFQERHRVLDDEAFGKYGSRQAFFDAMYDRMDKCLEGLTIKPECVYGDSVTPSTPVLIREKDGTIKVKTIETLNKEWKSYEGFKVEQTNRKEKQQNDGKVNFEIWSDAGWTPVKRVIRHKCQKRIFRILTHTGLVDVTEDHSLLNKDGQIIKPSECTLGTELLHSQLPNMKAARFQKDTQVTLMKKFVAMKLEGLQPMIDMDDGNIVIVPTNGIKNPYAIKKIIDIGLTNDFVYDIETVHGHFNAGIGEITVKNTDSVFVNFRIRDEETGELLTDKKSLETGIELGVIAGDEIINYLIPYPHELEYEKTFWPWISLSKKRYVGNLYEFNPDKMKCRKSMGIVLKRRDNAPIVKVVVGGIVDKILNERSTEQAVKFAKDTLKDIMCGNFPIEKFIVSKTLRANYKNRERMVHAVLADRIAERDPGNTPQSNDRIPYVYRQVKGNPKLQGERVESPSYVIEHGLKLDYVFYIKKQIMKPSIQFLEYMIKNPNKIFDRFITIGENMKKGKKHVKYYFQKLEEESSDDADGIMVDSDDYEEPVKKKARKKGGKRQKKVVVKQDKPKKDTKGGFSLDL